METKSGSQAKREGLYAEGLCRDCEAPLLDEELEADARRCVPGGGRAAQGEEAGGRPYDPAEISLNFI